MESIIGIGIDQVEIDRVLTACQKKGFLARYFTESEQKLIQKKETRAATNFAGKEAIAKCFGTGFYKLSPSEIEILRNEMGAPYIVLHGAAKSTAQKLRISEIHISLTDTKQIASAFAVAVGEKE